MKRLMLVAVLGLVGCGDAISGSREDDAGTGGAAQAGDAGTGGAAGAGTGGAHGTGGASVDAGGSGGAAQPGTGGSAGGSGGAAAPSACVDPDGWSIGVSSACYKPSGTGFTSKKKNGFDCATGCQSQRPGGGAGNYLGPPLHPECTATDTICVADCNECT